MCPRDFFKCFESFLYVGELDRPQADFQQRSRGRDLHCLRFALAQDLAEQADGLDGSRL
jgi:hypothetical protein